MVLKPLNSERVWGFRSLKRLSVCLHCGTPGRQNELPGLEFCPEAKDSGAVKMTMVRCARSLDEILERR